MSKLLDAFREQMEGGKFGYKHQESVGDVLYSTGFANIDYLNGYMVHVKNDTEDYYYPQVGIPDGKTVTVIGESGVGKSTLLIQIACNIAKQFPNSVVYHADLEGGTNDHRIEVLSKMSPNELVNKYHFQDSSISSEVFYEQIKWIHDKKLEDRNELTYDTGLVNFRGVPIFKLEPTLYIIDSIPMLMPDDILEQDELGGQMSTTSTVKANTFIFRKITQLCREANIMILSVNHILENVVINPSDRKKSTIKGLKQNERLPGGKSAQYLGNSMFRLDAGKTLKAEEGFGIDGYEDTIQTVKSRTNASGKSIPVIFDKDNGFSNELSLLQLLKINNKVKGAGAHLYLGDLPEVKFAQKNFLNILASSAQLRMELIKEAYPILESYMSTDLDLGYSGDEDDNTVDLNAMIRDMAAGKIPVQEMRSSSEENIPKNAKLSKNDVLDILEGELEDTEIPKSKKR